MCIEGQTENIGHSFSTKITCKRQAGASSLFSALIFKVYTLKNQRLKITQLEKARFIKVNELKLTEVELF